MTRFVSSAWSVSSTLYYVIHLTGAHTECNNTPHNLLAAASPATYFAVDVLRYNPLLLTAAWRTQDAWAPNAALEPKARFLRDELGGAWRRIVPFELHA